MRAKGNQRRNPIASTSGSDSFLRAKRELARFVTRTLTEARAEVEKKNRKGWKRIKIGISRDESTFDNKKKTRPLNPPSSRKLPRKQTIFTWIIYSFFYNLYISAKKNVLAIAKFFEKSKNSYHGKILFFFENIIYRNFSLLFTKEVFSLEKRKIVARFIAWEINFARWTFFFCERAKQSFRDAKEICPDRCVTEWCFLSTCNDRVTVLVEDFFFFFFFFFVVKRV